MLYTLKSFSRQLEGLIARTTNPTLRAFLKTVHFLNLALLSFYRDDGWYMAAALTFSGALSLVPTTAMYFSVFTSFGSFKESLLKARELLIRQFIPESKLKIYLEGALNDFTNNVYGITFVSVISVIVTSVMLYVTIEYALNRVFMVKYHPPFLRSLFVFTSLLFWGPILLGISGYMFIMAGQFPWTERFSTGYANHMLTFGVSWLLFFLSYYLLPYTNMAHFPCLLGGLVAGGLWEVAKYGFSVYISNAISYSQIYGTMAFIPVTLFWMYLSWGIFLYGAEIAFCYRFSGVRGLVGKDCEVDPVLLAQSTLAGLLIIGKCFRDGEPPPTVSDLSTRLKIPSHIIHMGLLALEEKRYLIGVNRRMDTFVPARPLGSIVMEEAFWATFSTTLEVEEEAPEMSFIEKVLGRMREGISVVFKGETLEEAIRRADQERAPLLSNVRELPKEQKLRGPAGS